MAFVNTFYSIITIFIFALLVIATEASNVAKLDVNRRDLLKTEARPTPCGIVGDAGSSGTRIYLFHGEEAQAKSHKHIQGGIAKQDVEKTMEDLRPVIITALGEWRDLCNADEAPSISILGTAGTRLLPEPKRTKLWNDLKSAVLETTTLKRGEFRTISGKEEGLFALIGANFLSRSLDHSLAPTGKSLVGVLDMGGASTQIALPNRIPTASVTVDDFFIESYLGYGLNELKTSIVKLHGLETLNKNCLFSDAGSEHPCQRFVTKVLDRLRRECQNDVKCGPIPKMAPLIADIQNIYMLSGYIYAVKFVHWIDPAIDISQPASLRDIKYWASTVCKQNYDQLKAKFTSETENIGTTADQFDERCLHMQYIVALLGIYGFSATPDKKMFHFTDTINGQEVDWPLGAYLYQSEHGHLPESPTGGWTQPHHIFLWFIIVAVLAFIFVKIKGSLTRKRIKVDYDNCDFHADDVI